jgi:hypothetical protein
MKTFALALLTTALALPAAAHAGEPALTVRDVPHHAARSLAAATPAFDMVGLHWRGAGTVAFSARSVAGRWGAWTRADDDHLVQRGWHIGGIDWVGAADAIRFRTTGHVSRLRAYYVQSTAQPIAPRRLQLAGSPLIISRFSWQADESIRRHAPRYADRVHYAVVHHTAGSNAYTREQSAAIVRGIEIYHVKGNGWDDIGYNFLVDKYGQVFEGRYGGVDRPVIGAHALGFNNGATGIAVIGSYSTTRISPAAKTALEQLLAWRLDVAHVDPLSTLTWRSGGNPRFPAGVPVFLRAISGHRDTGFTDCPGNALYAMLPQIAADVAVLGGPKIYAPLVQRPGEGQVRFTATLSSAQPWTVTVKSSSGVQVAQGAGSGTAVDWTWDESSVPPDRYTWIIAVPGARSASGDLGAVAVPAVQQTSVFPAAVGPGETATIGYTLATASSVTATLVSPSNQPVSTLFAAQKSAGAQTFALTPPLGLANGRYTVLISATAGSKVATAAVPLVLDDIVNGFAARGATLAFTLTRQPVSLAFQVSRGAAVVVTPPVISLAPGPQSLTWNGMLADGTPAPDGAYTLALTITDDVGTFTRSAPFTIDTKPPALRALSYRRLRFRVSEPSTLVLTVGARSFTRVLKAAGVTQFWLKTPPSSYVLTATDGAGNVTTLRYRR